MRRSLLSRAYRGLNWRLRQVIAAPSRLAGDLFATSYYDIVLSRRRTTMIGRVPPTPRVAIVLAFPRLGLKPSHISTLRYLVAKGYSPVVVSNLPLNQADRCAVLDTCWKLIERPNFGYDFGGYRDGVLSLGSDLSSFERLVFLNDSCWFPLPGGADWLDNVVALGVDFAGAASNYGVTPNKPGAYEASKWNYRADNKGFHYCSFALCVSGALLRDPGFFRFWKRFRLTNNKIEVVRRGEMGLTQWVLWNGFSHGATLDSRRLDVELDACSLARIREILQELIIPEEAELRAAKADLLARYDASEDWRRTAVDFILIAVAQTGISYVLPEYTVREKGFPFLKKSPLWLDKAAAESTLRIARSLDGADGHMILAEAKELYAGKFPSVRPAG